MRGEHIQELHTVNLTKFRTYKIALPNLGGEGASAPTDKHLPLSPFTGQFLRKAESISYFVCTANTANKSTCPEISLSFFFV